MISLRESQEKSLEGQIPRHCVSCSIATCNKPLLLKVSVSIDIFQNVQIQMESVKSDSLHT